MATRYASASDADQRRESLYALHETPAAEALPALARMWDAETDPDLQIELLDSLAVFTSGADAKVALLERVFSAHASPGDVKDAALDALLDIQDPAAVRLWQRLANDPSPEVRDLARTTLAEIAALDASD